MRNAGVSPLRPHEARTSVEMTVLRKLAYVAGTLAAGLSAPASPPVEMTDVGGTDPAPLVEMTGLRKLACVAGTLAAGLSTAASPPVEMTDVGGTGVAPLVERTASGFELLRPWVEMTGLEWWSPWLVCQPIGMAFYLRLPTLSAVVPIAHSLLNLLIAVDSCSFPSSSASPIHHCSFVLRTLRLPSAPAAQHRRKLRQPQRTSAAIYARFSGADPKCSAALTNLQFHTTSSHGFSPDTRSPSARSSLQRSVAARSKLLCRSASAREGTFANLADLIGLVCAVSAASARPPFLPTLGVASAELYRPPTPGGVFALYSPLRGEVKR